MKKNFETWARDMAPPMCPDEMNRKAHLAVLKDRMRTMERSRQQRHARGRKASMVAVFLCVTLMGGYLSELGSDNFAIMSQKHDAETGLDLVQVGHAGGVVSGESIDIEEMVDWVDQDAARLGKPVRCRMIEIDGKQLWLAFAEFNIQGQTEIRQSTIQDRPMEASDKMAAFFPEHYQDWVKDIKAGVAADEGTFYEIIDGHRYLCRTYTREFPKYGLVRMYRGDYAPQE